jgi:hypothetical protein
VKKPEKNFVKRIAHARTSKFVFFLFFNISDIVKVLKSKDSQVIALRMHRPLRMCV